MDTSTHSYAAFANSGGTGFIAASPTAEQAVTIVLADSGASQCTVAAYDSPAAWIDPETMDPLFEFEFKQVTEDQSAELDAQLQKALDAYELRELRKFKLETLRKTAGDEETRAEIARLEELLSV